MFKNANYVAEGGDGASEFPSNLQQRLDYVARTDGQPVYIGFAPKGAATSDSVWLIQKLTFTTIGSNDYLSLRQSSSGAWDTRATLTYS